MSATQCQQKIFQSRGITTRWFYAVLLLFSVPVQTVAAPDIEAAFPAASNLVTNGSVLTSASFGSSAGEDTGHGVAIDVNTALIDPAFPKVTNSGGTGQINAIVEDGLGGWVIGGDFTHVGGIALTNLAYIQADLTVSSDWRPNPDGVVHALKFHTREAGLRLLVGGKFTEIHGEPRSYFAELHTGSISKPVTTLDITLNPGGFVYAIETIDANDELEDRLVYIGGEFTMVQGTGPRDSNGDGQLDVDIAGLVGIDMDGDGIFETTKTIFADLIFDIDVDGDGDIDIDVNDDGNVDQTIDVKYDLSGIALDTPFEQTYPLAGDVRQGIASLDLNQTSNGMVVREWNPNVDGPVKVMVLAGDRGRLFIGGDFENIAVNVQTGAANDVARQSIAELDVTTDINVLTPWNPGDPGDPGDPGAKETTEIKAMLLQEFSTGEATANETGLLYVGGDFERIGGQDRGNFAVLDISLAGNNATSWDVDFSSGVVTSLAQTNETVYVGGEFSAVEGDVGFANLAGVLTVDGTLRTGWNPKPTNGPVMALAVVREGDVLIAGGKFTSVADESRLYIGGDFTYIGPSTGSGVVINDIGNVQPSWPEIDGEIYTAISDGADGWYIGGNFSYVNNIPRNNVARINADRSVNVWNPDANGTVYTLAVSGTNVVAGGDFTSIGGEPIRNYIAQLIGTGVGAATDWDPNANDVVRAITVNGDNVYVGGDFTLIGSQTSQPIRNHVAHFDFSNAANDDVATDWNPNANDIVRSLAVSGTNIIVGGDFSSIGGAPTRNYIAELGGAAAGAATNWNPNANDVVRALAVNGADVYVGGDFTRIGGLDRNHIALVDNAGVVNADWDPDADGRVTALMFNGTTLYVGGDFTFIGRLLRNRVAAFTAGSDVAESWNPSVGNTVYALSPDSATNIFIGGAFSSVGGVTREYLAAIDSSTGILSSNFNVGSDATVRDMALSADGDTLYVGGDFTSVGGQSRNHIAALKTATGSAWGWDPNIDGSSSTTTVHDIELSPDEGVLYVAGEFETIGGTARNNVGAIDVTSGGGTEWDPSVGGVVYTIALNDNALFIGGDFANINTNGQNIFRSHLAALNTAQEINNALAWAPAVDGPVYGMANAGSTLYIGGDFRFINDGGLTQARDYLAAIDTSANAFNLLSWKPLANGKVEAIALTKDAVFVGGDFTEINTVSRERLAALDFVDGAPLSWWDLRADTTVRHLGINGADERMVIGGDFKQVTATITPITRYLREGLTAVDVGFPRVVTNPPAGAYKELLESATSNDVTVSCIDVPRGCSGQAVYYTINSNTAPDFSGPVPSQTIDISFNTTLQLIARDDAGNQSEIQTMLYVIDEQPPATTALPAGLLPDGKILNRNDDLDIVLDCVDVGGAGCAEIYYTIDGTEPTDASTVYTGPITLSQNTTLKYFAFDQARNNEPDINEEQYWLDLAAPTVVSEPPTQVFYTEELELTLLCSDDTEVTQASIGDIPDANNPPQPDDPPVTGEESVDENDNVITGCSGVYYTLDNSTPTTASMLYTGPFRLSDSTVVKFIALDRIGNQSILKRSSYVKNYSDNVGAIGPLGGGLLLLSWLCWRFHRHHLVGQECRDRGLI